MAVSTLTAASTIGVVAALIAAAHPNVTKARLEHSLAPTFANLYIQQSAILGHPTTLLDVNAHGAKCDRGGPKVKDVGAGSDWICTID